MHFANTKNTQILLISLMSCKKYYYENSTSERNFLNLFCAIQQITVFSFTVFKN